MTCRPRRSFSATCVPSSDSRTKSGAGWPGSMYMNECVVVVSADQFAAHEDGHDRLLNVQAVLRLVPYAALRPIDHFGGDFLTAVRGQAVQEDRIPRGAGHQVLI